MRLVPRLSILAASVAIASPALAADIFVPTPPVVTPDPVVGYAFFGEAEIGGSAFWLSGNALEGDEASQYQALNLAARMGVRLANGLHLQGDVAFEHTTLGEDGATENDSYKSGVTYTGHLAYGYDGGVFGAFGGWLRTDQDTDTTDTSERYFAGVQGRHLLTPSFAAFGQAGYLWGTAGSDDGGLDSIRNAWFGRVGLSYYWDDNTRLSGAFLYMDGEMDDDATGPESARVWSIDVEAERQFTSNGLSGFARYSYTDHFQSDENDTIVANTVMVGLKWKLGDASSSLKDADFNGAITNMPELGRIVAHTGGPLE